MMYTFPMKIWLYVAVLPLNYFHSSPLIIPDHDKRWYIFQLIFDRFYDASNNSDPEGLSAMKVILNAKQVIPDNTRKNYYAASHFLDKVLDSLILQHASSNLSNDHPPTVEEGNHTNI